MSYTLTCQLARDHLRITVTGTWPSNTSKDIITGMHACWLEHQKRPLLIDIRSMRDKPTVVGDFRLAELFADTGFSLIGRIAVLDSEDRREANDFFETTAYNRGLTFRFFYADEQEAISWLCPEGAS